MKEININNTNLKLPKIAVGCMRLSNLNDSEAQSFINTAISLRLNFFDHADIYGGGGRCEEIFSKAIGMNQQIREQIIIQSKCGIRRDIPGKTFFDFSKDYILNSVDGILKRLKTDYLDILLLHRPDALVEPQEVAEAFDRLFSSGKVRYFGVSNQKPLQIELLQKYINQRIIINQLQLSITNSGMIRNGMNVNMENDASIDRDGSILDYCRLKDITIQPWSPLQYGFFKGVFIGNEKFEDLNTMLNKLSTKYNVTKSAIAIAWLLRHPAKMQPVIGTTNVSHLMDMSKSVDIELTREE